MIFLKELFLQAFPDLADCDSVPNFPIRGIECDSRKVEKDFLFVAVSGVKKDGAQFIDEAVSRGARVIVGEKSRDFPGGVSFVTVAQSRLALAQLAAAYYGHPSQQMKMIGITGTNGKTTSSFLIEHLLMKANKKTGVIGTVNYRYGGRVIPAVETTPGALRIQEMLCQMQKDGCEVVAMEVSSHALDQHRVSAVDFDAALFTNLSQDHLDYHGTLEHYFECKSRLFLELDADRVSILNADDTWAMKLREKTASRILTYGIHAPADFKAQNIRSNGDFTFFKLAVQGKVFSVELPLIGLHNVYNFLGSLATVSCLGADVERAVRAVRDFKGVPGRLEAVKCGQDFSVFIDFAHTPDGLENLLRSLLPCKKNRLIVVFGCGGERDKTKRPEMGRIASRTCDFVYVTSDNPRSEDPKTIAQEVQSGFPKNFKKFAVVLDRKKAVRQALLSARTGDIVVLAGKGHETVQVVGDQHFPYSERAEAERVLRGG